MIENKRQSLDDSLQRAPVYERLYQLRKRKSTKSKTNRSEYAERA